MTFVKFGLATIVAILLALLGSEIGRAIEPQNVTLFGPHVSQFTFSDLIGFCLEVLPLAFYIFFLAVIPIILAGTCFAWVKSRYNRIPIMMPLFVAPLCGISFWFQDNILMSGPDSEGSNTGMFHESISAYCWVTLFFFLIFFVVVKADRGSMIQDSETAKSVDQPLS